MSSIGMPLWVPLITGLVGIVTLLVKLIIDGKDSSIAALRDELSSTTNDFNSKVSSLERDNRKISDELKASLDFRENLDTYLHELSRQEATSETSKTTRRIVQHLKSLQEYSAVEADCRMAAKWIESRKEIWLYDIVEICTKKYEIEIGDKKKAFLNDVSECLSWLYDSVRYNIDHEFSDYLPQRSVDSIHPYRRFFSELKNRNDFGELNPKEADVMNQYLDSLIQLLKE